MNLHAPSFPRGAEKDSIGMIDNQDRSPLLGIFDNFFVTNININMNLASKTKENQHRDITTKQLSIKGNSPNITPW